MEEVPAIGRTREASPRTVARLIGVLTLLTVIGGIYAQVYVGGQLIQWRDAAATAANILAHRDLYLSAVAVYFVEMACGIATTALLYVLLKPAGRSLAMVSLCLGLTANVIKTGGRVLFASPLYVLGSTRFPALGSDTLNDLSLLLLLVNDHAAGIAMAFFGFNALVAGWLMLRARYLPRILGMWSIVGGLGWVTHVWPPLGYRVNDIAMLVGVLGVFVQMFWFLIKGVDEQRWHEQARSHP
jgi:uncharacterized protein DUF4386